MHTIISEYLQTELCRAMEVDSYDYLDSEVPDLNHYPRMVVSKDMCLYWDTFTVSTAVGWAALPCSN